MKKFNLYILKIVFCLLICYVSNKMSDTYLSGGIAGILCTSIIEIIDKKIKEE